jgi:hypothetical protein
VLDAALWDQAVGVSVEAGIIPEAPAADAYRTDLAEAAIAALGDADTKGTDFANGTVEVTEGGN